MPAKSGRRIVVEFLGEDKSLSSTAKRVEGTTGKLGGRLGKVGLIAGGVLAAGFGAAAGAMVQMTKNAAEDEAGQRRLAVALKNATGASKAQVAGVEDWISKQGTAFGVTDDELRPSLQRLVQATGDVGKAQKLAGIAMDASAGSGKSLETVSTAIAKAQNGNMGALSRLGIKIKDADGKALSFNDAMKEMSKTFGGQAAAKANSFQGKMDRLKLVFDETKEAIGARLIPVATKLAGWFLDKGLPALTKFGKYLQKTLGPVFATIGKLMQKFGKDGESSSGAFGKAMATIRSVMKSVSGVVRSAVSIIQSLWKRFGGDITSFTKSTFGALLNVIGGSFKIISGVFKVFSSLLKGDWKGVWDGIKMIVSGAWQVIKGIVQAGWAAIKLAFNLAIGIIKGVFVGLWNALKGAAVGGWNAIKGAVTSGWNSIKSAFSSAGSAIKNAFGSAWDWMKSKATSTLNFFRGLPAKMSTALSGMWDGLKSAFRGAINWVIGKWNGLSFTIGGQKVFGKTLPGVTIGTPNLPLLARGGIVKGSKFGTPIRAGDGGNDEAIVPLTGPHARGLGGDTYVFHINGVVGDEDAVAQKVEQILSRRRRQTGRELAFV